ncbi:CheR family methyltransferase, partial [Rhodopseudomonas palustris]|uniref:CheR family methyltransferase n=2 Tax=Rhodopseudomonas TaxID=1073 RepID=UPI0006427EFD
DVIFCRNVLIYFDQPTKSDIFNRLMRVNEPDGYLFLGAAETVVGLTDSYRICPKRRGVYLPNTAAASAAPSFAAGGLKAGALTGR